MVGKVVINNLAQHLKFYGNITTAKVLNKLKGLSNIKPRYVVHQLCQRCDPCHDCMNLKPHTNGLKVCRFRIDMFKTLKDLNLNMTIFFKKFM
jgi:hypothetical protein